MAEGRKGLLSTRKITVLAFDLDSGSETYVWRPPISSTCPTGVPSWTLPLRQQELIPTPVDIVTVILISALGDRSIRLLLL